MTFAVPVALKPSEINLIVEGLCEVRTGDDEALSALIRRLWQAKECGAA